ncbi:hypothetical protein ACFOGJ_08670 [Marinibaculum pumilum]|uniref:Uncharacterized protein n=1 Tax=Marinibaculum pumilum TaxID=1766165 RepID=A0ABV7KYB1_9PROT
MARKLSGRPDPAAPAWVGLAAVLALLLVHGLTGPAPRRTVLDRGPFEPPIVLYRLGQDG